MNKRKTKIVCTIGPTCDSLDLVKQLLESGMTIARFNFSHGSHEEHKERIHTVLTASKETGIPVATLLDTKGPQIRTGKTIDGEKITLEEGSDIIVTGDKESLCTPSLLSVNHTLLSKDVSKGVKILIADGLIELEVQEIRDAQIFCKVITGGSFGSNKNVNVIGTKVSLPILTEADIEDIAFGASMNMDFLAASFVQTVEDILSIKAQLEGHKAAMKIIAKIETKEALDNIHSIVLASSGAMVARGDLGVQLKPEDVPMAQKTIIRICNQYGKAVITATQMLESMIVNPRPTRAEATDVANAILDGTDAIMLSAETANGKYPVQAVKTMHNIASKIESSKMYREHCKQLFSLHEQVKDVRSAVTKSTCITASDTKSSAIIAPTLRGNSPHILSMFRPSQPIIAPTSNEQVYKSLLIYSGVYPVLLPKKDSPDIEEIIDNTIAIAMKENIVRSRDFVTVAAGLPLTSATMLNTIMIRFVGKILQRGFQGYGTFAEGIVYHMKDIQKARQDMQLKQNLILVCEDLNTEDFSLLRHVKGIVCNSYLQVLDDLVYHNPQLVVVAGIHTKVANLEEGKPIGLSGGEMIIYEIES